MNYKKSYDWFLDLATTKSVDQSPFVLDYAVFNKFKQTGIDYTEKIQYLLNHNEIKWITEVAFIDLIGEPRLARTIKLDAENLPSHRINTTLYLYNITITSPIYSPIDDKSYIKIDDGMYIATQPYLTHLETFDTYREIRYRFNLSKLQDVYSDAECKHNFQQTILSSIHLVDKYLPTPQYGIVARYSIGDKF